MRNVMIGALAVLLCVGAAQAAITVSASSAASSIAGYTKYTVTATAPVGEKVIGIEDLVVGSTVAQVWKDSGSPTWYPESITGFFDNFKDESLNRVAQPATEAAWQNGDTHLLIWDRAFVLGPSPMPAWETSVTAIAGHGIPVANYYDDDAGEWKTQAARVRTGAFAFPATTMVVVGNTQRANSLAFLQVVIPDGSQRTVTGKLGTDAPGAQTAPFSITLPEPATMSLLVLGGVAMIARKRR